MSAKQWLGSASANAQADLSHCFALLSQLSKLSLGECWAHIQSCKKCCTSAEIRDSISRFHLHKVSGYAPWAGYSSQSHHYHPDIGLTNLNPSPAEPGYVLSLQTVQIQISWLLKKPTDLDLHCLPLSMWIYSSNLDQVIWLAEK